MGTAAILNPDPDPDVPEARHHCTETVFTTQL